MTIPVGLSPAHRAYLNDHAVSDEVIEAQGIRSEGDMIVFTWRDGEHATEQRRAWPGAPGAYLWEAGKPLHLNVIRDPGPDAPVLLCEGTKQSLAVASWAPPEYAVFGMPGCYGWLSSEGLDLSRFAGRDVIIMLDADAADNLNVYEAGERLARELGDEEPAAKASFVPSPAWGKDGIDDYLHRVAAGKRTQKLARLVTRGQDKPADKKPTKRKLPSMTPDTGGRPLVVVNRDILSVIHEVTGIIRTRWDSRDLFCYGGVLTRLRGHVTEPLDKDAFANWLAEGVATYRYREPGIATPGKYEPAWPDPQTMGALLARGDEFAPLDRVSRTPFARADGSVCAKQGYDASTRTMLVTGNSGMDRLDIPDAPDAGQAAKAAQYLLEDWLGDMPFRDPESRANALALVLTPFIRGIVPLVPVAVISGLQMGVGKNLLADCVSLLTSGEAGLPLPWIPDDDDEVRKQILSAFRGGASLLCFDEAHVLGGAALTRAVTALTYSDRILGVSKMASFPNRVTWMALGNQVQTQSDMARRAYYIELYPDCPDPQDRDESAFRHPDLRGWTTENRPELVTAALVIIRAWFAADCPAFPRGSLMGSFEPWDKMIAGMLGHAGVPGFLGNLSRTRAERDMSGGFWGEHLAWLRGRFGYAQFTALEVKAAALASGGTWESPPGLDSPGADNFTLNLGHAYRRNQDRWYGPLRIVKQGTGHGKLTKWQIEERTDSSSPPSPPIPPSPPSQVSEDVLLADPEITEALEGTEDFLALHAMRVPAHARSRACAHTYMREGEGAPSNPSVTSRDVVSAGQGARGSLSPTPPSYVSAGQAGFARTQAPATPSVLVFDLEGGAADELFTYRDHDERGYVRLAGITGPSGETEIVATADLLAVLNAAPAIAGHNILGYDLLALARHHGADYDRLAAKATDTELVARQADPPRSRETHSADSYDLTSVAERLGVPGKSDDLKRLKQVHGGYDKIPLDDPEYRSYLEGDLRSTAAVLAVMHERWNFASDPYIAREHRLAALAGRMTLTGFAVDAGLLEQRYAEGEERKRQALELLHDGWGLPLGKTVTRGRGKDKHEEPVELKSPLAGDAGREWLAGIWERYGIPDPPRTGKTQKLAIGDGDLKAVREDPRCDSSLRSLLGLMSIVTTTRTVYQTARDCLAPDGRVHPGNSFRQASGRWSVTNPGLTVFGKRGGRHVERDIFLPDPGHVLLSFDLSQVDMRAMAWLSGDHAYRALFAPGRDAHAEIAAQVGIARQDAKAIGHGWNYGLGAKRMIASGLDPEKVDRFIDGMEARFPRLIAWREQIREQGRAGEVLDNGFGRRMRCDPSRAYTVAPALMGQGGARDIMGECLLKLDRSLWPLLRVMVHDEIVISVPKEDATDVSRQVIAAMTWQLDEDIPVLCDMSGGQSWGEASAK